MTLRITVGIIAMACLPVCGMVSSFALFEMMDKVNEKLPRQERFAPAWWYAGKYSRLFRDYKRLYPEGRLQTRFQVLTALMFVCLLVCVWGFGTFRK
jgi:hypothetical protein